MSFEALAAMVLLAAGLVIVAILVSFRQSPNKPIRRTQWRGYSRYPQTTWHTPPVPDLKSQEAVDQLQVVMSAEFTARPILNRSEARVFDALCQLLSHHKPGWRVMAQVSLGEVLRSRNTDAFRCINAKRVDMLLIDEKCRPRCAIEYQGGAHYQGAAAARDAVKKEALRRAGIDYHEVVAGRTTAAELRQFLQRLVSKLD